MLSYNTKRRVFSDHYVCILIWDELMKEEERRKKKVSDVVWVVSTLQVFVCFRWHVPRIGLISGEVCLESSGK